MGRAFEYRKAAKEKRWSKMSRIFPRLSKAITVAAKNGGSNPDMNPRLRSAILMAKAENMPKNNIESAIKRATDKSFDTILEVTFEGKGVHGVLIFVECATDNNTRTVANIKNHFKKTNGEVLNNGSLEFMFDRKTVIEVEKSEDIDLEELELELIDFGLEEIEEDNEKIYIYGDYSSFGELTNACDKLKLNVKKATLQRIATNPIEFTDAQIEEIGKTIERLEEDEDVQNVYTNIA